MSEATRSGLAHPTPIHIINVAHDVADELDAERKANGQPPIGWDVMQVIRTAIRRANKEFHDELG